MTNPTTITSPPGLPFVDLVREFDASAAAVFRAHTDPQLFAQWMGPRTMKMDDVVLDATTGQNGLTQAREFREATDVTGVVLTKLDGSAKGGIVFAIEDALDVPVRFVGVGEQVGDLIRFDPDAFVDALFA